MGGLGSGRTGGRLKIEDSPALSIRELLRAGALLPGERKLGTWSWTNRHSGDLMLKVAVVADLTNPQEAAMALVRLGGSLTIADQRVELVGVSQPFGGLRWWFSCNVTGRRHGMLLLPPGAKRFGSRHEYDLVHRSTRISTTDRALAKMHRRGERLGLEPGHLGAIVKPTGMHERTFARELARYRGAEHRACGYMAATLMAMQVRRA